MRTAAQRIAAYNARMLSSLIDPVLSAVNTQQQANFADYASDFVPKQDQLHAILNGLGVAHVYWFAYEAFHNELYHLNKHFSGAAAIAYATTLAAKYVDPAFGTLVLANLQTIANDIYGIVIPGGA